MVCLRWRAVYSVTALIGVGGFFLGYDVGATWRSRVGFDHRNMKQLGYAAGARQAGGDPSSSSPSSSSPSGSPARPGGGGSPPGDGVPPGSPTGLNHAAANAARAAARAAEQQHGEAVAALPNIYQKGRHLPNWLEHAPPPCNR